jgi:hypothetical protein
MTDMYNLFMSHHESFYSLPPSYSPMRQDVPVDHGLLPQRFEVLKQQFITDGIIRVCQIGGLLIGLKSRGTLLESDFSGKVINLGVGTGADIVASSKLGADAIGVDDRSITQGFLLGSWCPIPEFIQGLNVETISTPVYRRESAIFYLKSVPDNSFDLITAFDAVPSMIIDVELSALIFQKLKTEGKFILTQRSFADPDIHSSGFSSSYLTKIAIPDEFNYVPVDWTKDIITQYFPQYLQNSQFLAYVESGINQIVSSMQLRRRDSLIEVWMKCV